MLFDHLPESARHAYPCLSLACLRWPCLLPYSLHLVSCWSSVWLWALRCGCNPYIDTLWLSLISVSKSLCPLCLGVFNIVFKFFNGQSVRMWKQLADRKRSWNIETIGPHWIHLHGEFWKIHWPGIFGRRCLWACAWISATMLHAAHRDKMNVSFSHETRKTLLNLRPWAHYGDKVGKLTDEESTKKTS